MVLHDLSRLRLAIDKDPDPTGFSATIVTERDVVPVAFKSIPGSNLNRVSRPLMDEANDIVGATLEVPHRLKNVGGQIETGLIGVHLLHDGPRQVIQAAAGIDPESHGSRPVALETAGVAQVKIGHA